MGNYRISKEEIKDEFKEMLDNLGGDVWKKTDSAYIWIDEYGRTQITLTLRDLAKIFSGKTINLNVK